MDTVELRNIGKNVLNLVLTVPNNVILFEEFIYNRSEKDHDKFDISLENMYRFYLYEIIGSILKKHKLTAIVDMIKSGHLGWNHPRFEDLSKKLQEQDDFREHPFEVEEGVLECFKCNGKKTLSYQKQTRSADEPMTTFVTCVGCKNKWKYSG